MDLLLMFFYCICINESLTITETESLPSQDFLGSLQRLKDVLSEVECKQQAIASGLSDPSKVEKALQQTKVILIFFFLLCAEKPQGGCQGPGLSPFIGALLLELGADVTDPRLAASCSCKRWM